MRIDAVAQAPGPACDPPAKVRDAAQQFEALLLGQMLKQMREGGWMGTSEDEAGATMLELAEEHLARALATQGGLGLANLIVSGLQEPVEDPIK